MRYWVNIHMLKLKLTFTLGFAAVLMLLPGRVFSAGSQADYLRAQSLRERFSDKVFRDSVDPHWFSDGTMFWYRVTTGPKMHEYVLVDAEKGLRQSAFDHVRLAEAMTAAGVRNAQAAALPLEKLEFQCEHKTVQFQADGKLWICNLETYELKLLGEAQDESLQAFPPDRAPRGSVRTGVETQLTFINRTEKEVELFWLDSGGERRSYGVLEPGGQSQQHTYAGHVWLAADKEGNSIAVWQAVDQRAKVLIGVETPPIENNRTDPLRRRSRQDRPGRAVSPDEQWRAFIKEHNVWLHRLQDGVESQLSTDGTADHRYTAQMVWSPDSRKLAVIRQQPAQEHKVYFIESSPKDQLQPKLHSIDYLKPGDRMAMDKPQLFDVATMKQIPVSDDLFSNPYAINGLHWKPDSSRFMFVYNQRGHQVLRVVAIDASSGQATAIIEEKSNTFICYSSKFLCDYIDETNEIIWMSERDGWNHLYLYDARAGQVKNQITKGPWVVRSVEHIDKDKRQIWFRVGGIHPQQDPYYLHFARINFDGSGLTMLTEGNGSHTVRFSPDRRFYVDSWSRVDTPPVHELRRSEDGKLSCELERADATALVAAGWQTPQPFVAKGRDGQTDIYGVILRPVAFDPNQRYPIIESIYAGPQDSFVPKSFSPFYRMMELTELGFILVQIDGMGTSNRSKAFHDVCWKNLADAGLPDRVLWIKAAAQQYPYMDAERVGIYGGSAGGQSAAAAVMTHGDFYKAAVADCGCHDNRMDKLWWNEQWMGWPVGPHYAANSNVTLAPGLKGKLLLIVGEMDTNVDPASTMQVVDALIKADKDFDLLIVPGGGHGIAESRYASRRRADFFVRHLLGTEPRRE